MDNEIISKAQCAIGIKAASKAFIEAKGIASWGQREHNAFLINLIERQLGPMAQGDRIELLQQFEFRGLGGNSSQFRQFLAHKDQGFLRPAASAVDAIKDRYAGLLGEVRAAEPAASIVPADEDGLEHTT